MKKLLLMWIALLAFGVSFGQSISDYAFSASSGTFTPITGGIAVSTSTSAADFLGDTKTSTAIPIGFTFTYLGVPYTDLVAMSDGYISFNLSATSSLTNNLTSSSSTQRPLLAPLWDDLDGASGTGAANYITEGAAGSRIFTIEWLNWQWNYGATGATISFQIKLYEATGKIEFIYTPAGGTVNNASASIGITGIPTGAGNFLSLNGSGASPAVSSTTETTNISSLPAAGQVYTFTPASCSAPGSLTATNITTTSADLGWTSAATSFQIEYGPAPLTPGTGTRVVTSSNPFSISSLSANTSYSFYIRSICAVGDTSNWAGPMTFTTACDVASIPFFEGFENNNVQDAAIANCWTQEAVSGTDQILANTSITTYNRTPRTGSWNAFLEYSNDRWMFQALSLTAATSYTFEMYVRQDATSGAEVSVFYGTAANAAAMTEMIVDTTLVTNGNYQLITGTFTPATTGTYYLGIESKLTFAPYYISIDDIKVVETPTCIAPTNLDATDLATDSANLSWTSAATEFQIEYGVSSYTFGTGTRTITSNNPYSLTGLSANTSYDFYVRAICSAGDTSDWTGPFTFTTNCAAISAFPWIETFNSTSTTENCWSIIDANADGTLWDMSDNGAPIEGDESAIIYTDYNYGANDDYLITPQLTLTGNQQMKFLYKVESSSEPNDFEVLLSTTGANPADFTHVILDSASYSNEDPEEQIIYLDSYTGNVYIAFHIPENGLDGWVLYIDSVVVENIPSCPEPLSLQVANIASDSADLSWTSSASEFQIEYGVSPLTLGTGTRIITSNNPHSLTGLTASTSYDFYVRAICAAGDTSDWAGPITFTTNCDAVNVPYSENFDGVTTPDIPDCMSVSNDNGDGYSWYTNTTYPNSAPNYMHIRWNTSLAMDDWFYTPGLILTGGTTYQVKFSYRSSSTYDEKFEIKFGQSNSAAGMTGGQIFADSAVITSTYITDSATFIPATSGIYYVGFHGFSDADMNFLAVDDISVTEVVTLNNEAEIITFTIPSQVSSNVNSAAATVDVVMPNGTDVTALIPAITVSTGASIVPNSGVAQNFTNSVVYTVTAEDGITTKDWTVTVTVLSSIENAEYSVSYYPNPATNMLNLDLSELPTGDYRLELLNMQGQKVMDKILVNDGNVISSI
ncbi:MAG: choice-of-anchor J domain-containing protein [Bacteroidales bacterium]